ncbi:hypothetical protein HBB16_13680 [Pseudonocardia sp. MCCB 268]|nr:hypothetical protein [Pseudonocardia cytotoxica]
MVGCRSTTGLHAIRSTPRPRGPSSQGTCSPRPRATAGTWPVTSSSGPRTTRSTGPADRRDGRRRVRPPRRPRIPLIAAGVGLHRPSRWPASTTAGTSPATDRRPGRGVVLTWPDAENTDLMEEFIGVVPRGRTVSAPHAATGGRLGSADPTAGKKATARRRQPAR